MSELNTNPDEQQKLELLSRIAIALEQINEGLDVIIDYLSPEDVDPDEAR